MSTVTSKGLETNRRIEHLALALLRPDPRNPKAHATEVIDSSVSRFGFIEPVVLDERTGHIVSGHGRVKTLEAMKARGEVPPEGIMVNDAGEWLVPTAVGWASRSDTEAGAALIALNRAGELGGWVDDALLDLLDGLSLDEDAGLVGVGFDTDDIDALRARLSELAEEPDEVEEEEDRAPTTGEMLTLADVSWGEPKHHTRHGEVWALGRHLLVLAKVHDEHALWSPLLARLGPEAIFAPYPEPFLTTGTLALSRPHLLVQPNPYLAGHLLDKHASVFPAETVERIA